jgi:Tol biopolymer transport system component
MKKIALGMLLGAAAISTPTSLLAQVAQSGAKPQAATEQATPARYSAATFFNTTSYGVAAAAGFGFSPDGKSLLITSDQNGVFNAYSLPIDGPS